MQRQCNAVVYRVNVAGPPTKIEERLVLGRGLDYPPVAEQGTAPPLSPARLIRARSGRNGTRVNLSNLRNWSETSRVEEPGTFDAVRHEPCDSDQFVVAMGWPSGELAQAHCLGFFAPANRNGGELFSDNSLPSEPSAETGPSGSAEEDEYRMSEELKKREEEDRRSQVLPRHFEAVAYPPKGLEVLRVTGVHLDFLAKPPDVDIDGAGRHERRFLPHGFQ